MGTIRACPALQKVSASVCYLASSQDPMRDGTEVRRRNAHGRGLVGQVKAPHGVGVYTIWGPSPFPLDVTGGGG